MRGRYPLSFVLIAALAGCGGGSPSEQAVEAATTWVEALREDELDRACAAQLSSATSMVRTRYLAGEEVRGCPEVMRLYRERLGDGLLDRILERPLEPQSKPDEDVVGVFPAAEGIELQVILMRRVDDEWKVARVGITPAE